MTLLYEFFRQRHIILPHFFCRRCMPAGKVMSVRIVLQEQRFKVCQMVIFAKQSPDAVILFRSEIVPLMGLYLGKFVYQRLVYHEMLPSVCPWGFVFMHSDSFNEKVGHFQVRIAQ